jgi:hypothetical protein
LKPLTNDEFRKVQTSLIIILEDRAKTGGFCDSSLERRREYEEELKTIRKKMINLFEIIKSYRDERKKWLIDDKKIVTECGEILFDRINNDTFTPLINSLRIISKDLNKKRHILRRKIKTYKLLKTRKARIGRVIVAFTKNLTTLLNKYNIKNAKDEIENMLADFNLFVPLNKIARSHIHVIKGYKQGGEEIE